MNILHMKYAVEVARIGSLNKAAGILFIAPPNLSRSIKELENELGITIFERSSRGMGLTAEGEEFVRYAERALRQIDDIERKYKSNAPLKQRFSVSVPRASYISDAFAAFSKTLGKEKMEIFYQETNALRSVHSQHQRRPGGDILYGNQLLQGHLQHSGRGLSSGRHPLRRRL